VGGGFGGTSIHAEFDFGGSSIHAEFDSYRGAMATLVGLRFNQSLSDTEGLSSVKKWGH